jgi:hypothetical protein
MITLKKMVLTAVIVFFGMVLAGFESLYPTLAGYRIFNEITIIALLTGLYNALKHSILRNLP